jgi:hypothetical protein
VKASDSFCCGTFAVLPAISELGYNKRIGLDELGATGDSGT